jgi:hypothetical protein
MRWDNLTTEPKPTSARIDQNQVYEAVDLLHRV